MTEDFKITLKITIKQEMGYKSELKKLREAIERIEGEPSGIIDI